MSPSQSPLPLEISCQAVRSKQLSGEHFLLLDCREPAEYQTARIDGSTLIPMSQLQARVAELDSYRDSPIVVHCHHGGRSLRVTHWLRNQGFTAVQNLSGGIEEWALQIDQAVPRY